MKIIGHRGAAGHATENSLEAFEIAFDSGVDGVELDVKLVHDRLLVFHDDELDRVTNATGKLSDLTRTKLKQVRLLNGEPIPTLEDVWDITPPQVLINIELKALHTAKPTIEFIYGHSHRFLVSSFYRQELGVMLESARSVERALLIRELSADDLERARHLQVINVHLWDRITEKDSITQFIEAGFKVFVFSVNEIDRAIELQNLGVSGVFTDEPRTLVPAYQSCLTSKNS